MTVLAACDVLRALDGTVPATSHDAVALRTAIRDLHATILHQLGIDHEKLTFRSQGLDFRLTGVDPATVPPLRNRC